MNRAATEDVRSPVWPIVTRVLASSGPAPDRARRPGGGDPRRVGDARRPAPRRRPRRELRRRGPDHPRRRCGAGSPMRSLRPVFGDLVDRPRRGARSRRAVGSFVRGQGPADAAGRPGERAVPPALLRRRLAGRAGRRCGRRSDQAADELARSRARSRRVAQHGLAHRLRAGSCRTRSGRRTGRRSSRCWSWCGRKRAATTVIRCGQDATAGHMIRRWHRRRAGPVVLAIAW